MWQSIFKNRLLNIIAISIIYSIDSIHACKEKTVPCIMIISIQTLLLERENNAEKSRLHFPICLNLQQKCLLLVPFLRLNNKSPNCRAVNKNHRNNTAIYGLSTVIKINSKPNYHIIRMKISTHTYIYIFIYWVLQWQ